MAQPATKVIRFCFTILGETNSLGRTILLTIYSTIRY